MHAPTQPSRMLAGRLALALALAAACDPEVDAGAGEEAAADEGTAIDSVEYTLTWSWGHATPSADGSGWSTVNDLGYRVEVERGYLVAYSASLSPCTPATVAEATATASLGERLLGRLALPTTAFAGHAEIADPSQVEDPQVEDLAAPSELRFGAASFDADTYCWLHYLAAHADEATRGLPEDPDLTGITLYLEGHVELSEGSAEPFTIAATSASGILVDLADALAQPNGAGTHASVVVTRDLARAFDGIDFVNDDPAELDRAVLRNLVQGSSVEIRLSAGSE